MKYLTLVCFQVLCALFVSKAVAQQGGGFSGWFFVNTIKQNGPDCIPLSDDPMSSLARTFGNAPMRVMSRSETVDGRLMVIEVPDVDGHSRFGFATSESACKRLKAAFDGISEEFNRLDRKSNGFSISIIDAEDLKRRDSRAFCDGDSCVTKLTDFVEFRSMPICLDETQISFGVSGNRTASCQINKHVASDIRAHLAASVGAPSIENRSVFRVHSQHARWILGRNHVEIVHWTGRNVNGVTINNWSIDLSASSEK